MALTRLCRFAVIADVQYANKPDGHRDDSHQHYKASAVKLKHAIDHINAEKDNVEFVLNMGDIIDGNATQQATTEDLEVIGAEFDRCEVPAIHHVVGNHCLRVPREHLQQRLSIPHPCYYTLDICKGWKLVVIDTTEMSEHSQYPQDSIPAKEAKKYKEEHENEENALPWNGGLSSVQRAWLQEQLSVAEKAGERCIVAGHHPIGKGAARPKLQAWDAAAVECILNSSTPVKAVFNGHDHRGGYAMNEGVHYIAFEAMLESPEDSTAYAFVDLFSDKLVITGFGTVTSRKCSLR